MHASAGDASQYPYDDPELSIYDHYASNYPQIYFLRKSAYHEMRRKSHKYKCPKQIYHMMNTVAVTRANKTGGSLRGWDNTKDFAVGAVVPFG
jgi:hypothetical protein